MDTRSKVLDWHKTNGGKNVRLAGHALRLLNEAVELCVASGASADEIGSRVAAEIAKLAERGEFKLPVDFSTVRDELSDVTILGDVLASYTGSVDLTPERERKIIILHERKWEADRDGVLWRPGHCPQPNL